MSELIQPVEPARKPDASEYVTDEKREAKFLDLLAKQREASPEYKAGLANKMKNHVVVK